MRGTVSEVQGTHTSLMACSRAGSPLSSLLEKWRTHPPCPGPQAPPCHLSPDQLVSKPSLDAFLTLPLERPWRAPRLETAA